MTYIPAHDASDGVARVIYESRNGKTSKTFAALGWMAQLTTHIPNRGEQMVRYYGYYSNKLRGLRNKAGTDDEVPALIDSDISRNLLIIRSLDSKLYISQAFRGFRILLYLQHHCTGTELHVTAIYTRDEKIFNSFDAKRLSQPRAFYLTVKKNTQYTTYGMS